MQRETFGQNIKQMREIIMFCVVTLMPLVLMAQGPDWFTTARTFAAEHPENKGLPHLIEALSQMDFQSTAPHDAKLKAIAADGWTQSYPEIQQLLQSKSAALVAAVQAAEAAPFDLPPQTSAESPVPNFLAVTMTVRLLACEARRLEAAGDLGSASQRAVQAARFSIIFGSKDQVLIGHLISISGMGVVYPALASIVTNPKTTPETLKFIGASLYEIEQKRTPSAAAYELEKKVVLAGLEKFDELKKSYPEMAKEIEMYYKHKDEYERIMNAIIENESKPYWQRLPVKIVIKQASTINSIKFELPNSDESSARETLMIAKLRLLQARCAERLGLNDAAAGFLDPFTGQPLKITPQAIYSLGPDQTDQGGNVVYDSSNGTISAGDVVLRK